jgi:phospholipase D1/2
MRRFLPITALILTMLGIWNWSPLSQWATPEVLADWLDEIATNSLAGPICIAAFVLGSLVVFPVTVLIAMTAVAFGPWQGLIWASAGAMLAAAVNYAGGYMIPDAVRQRWSGSLLQRINKRLRNGSIIAIALLRSVPIAPFTVINLVAGAARIPFREYMIGTALGMAPGIIALTLLGDRLRFALQDLSWVNIGLLLLAVALWVGITLGVQRISDRLVDAR